MISQEIELLKTGEDGSPNYFSLPDRFLSGSASARAWGLIFNNRKKLKDVSDDLLKCKLFEGFTRKVLRTLPPELVISTTLGSYESRAVLFRDYSINFDYDDWIGLLKSCHARLAKKLPAAKSNSFPLDISKYNINIADSRIPDRFALDLLNNFVDVEAYETLSFDDKDVADFIINGAISEINDPLFIVDFLAVFPAYCKRNQSLLAGAERMLRENTDEDTELTAEDQHKTLLLNGLSSIASRMATSDEPTSLNTIAHNAKAVFKIVDSPDVGLRAVCERSIVKEELHFLAMFNDVISSIKKTGSLDVESIFSEAFSLIGVLGAPVSIPQFDVDFVTSLTTYCTRRSDSTTTLLATLEGLGDDTDSFVTFKEAVVAEASKPSPDLNILVEASTKLKLCGDKIRDSAIVINTCFLNYLEETRVLRYYLQAKSTEHVSVVDAFVDASSTTSTSALVYIEHERAALADQLKSAEISIAKLNERAISLVSEVKKLRRENHDLKQRSSFSTTSEVIPPTETSLSPEFIRNLVTQTNNLTPEAVLNLYEQIASDRIAVLPSAYKSAKASSDFNLGSRLAGLIDSLVYSYLDAILDGKPDTEAKKILGNSYAAKESETVMSNKRLKSLREFQYNGEKVLFFQHVGVGRNYGTQHAIRVYFKVIDEKIVIAYCGAHLESAQTN